MVRMSVIKRKLKLPKFIHTSLLKFHFLLAFRNLKRNKVFSAVNIFGLAAALTICLFAVNMIYTGYQYNKDFKDVDRLYRITTSVESPHGKMNWATSSFALKWHLGSIPQIEASSIILTNMYGYFEVNGQDIHINGYPIDREFLDMFDFEVIEGNPYDFYYSPYKFYLLPENKYTFSISYTMDADKLKSKLPKNILADLKHNNIEVYNGTLFSDEITLKAK